MAPLFMVLKLRMAKMIESLGDISQGLWLGLRRSGGPEGWSFALNPVSLAEGSPLDSVR